MSTPAPRLAREAGMALAVLAIYVLTLLLPLHQAAGLQSDLDDLGFSRLDNWSLCASLADTDPASGDTATCPALGVAKQHLAIDVPPAITVDLTSATVLLHPGFAGAPSPRVSPDHVGQSRAPPIAV